MVDKQTNMQKVSHNRKSARSNTCRALLIQIWLICFICNSCQPGKRGKWKSLKISTKKKRRIQKLNFRRQKYQIIIIIIIIIIVIIVIIIIIIFYELKLLPHNHTSICNITTLLDPGLKKSYLIFSLLLNKYLSNFACPWVYSFEIKLSHDLPEPQ